MMYDLHIHMLLDGVDFRAAIAMHRPQPNEPRIRQVLAAYQSAGVTHLRDGGDRFGVCRLAKAIAPEYGITYRIPTAPLFPAGRYGAFLGCGWSDWTEYQCLLQKAKAGGADFIKLMLSGIMDFSRFGELSDPPLSPATVKTAIGMAHEAGFSVMAHCNGAPTVLAAVEAGVDSIEHGAYLTQEVCCALAESRTAYIPTVSAIGNLIGCGRFPDEVLRKIVENSLRSVHWISERGGKIGIGSDAGAYCVPHVTGARTERQWLRGIATKNAQIFRIFSRG